MNGSFTGVVENIMNFVADDTRPEPIYSDEDSFARGAALDELNIRIRARRFRGGKLTSVMSGVTLDLREATLDPDGATIDLQTALSDIDLLVPHDWHVDCEVDGIFSGIHGERFPPPANDRAPRLRVTGMVVAGGLWVR